MNKNYMIFPMKWMRITQTYLGSTSHIKHTTGTPKDYPIDCAGKDTGQDTVFCPCDEMVITAIRGYKNKSVTNTVWLVSTTPVTTPTFTDICFMSLTHMSDRDLEKLKVGQKLKRKEVICSEGKDGATANHIHIVVGRGSSNNWTKNTSDAWVIVGNTKKPEEIFYVDKDVTEILSTNGLEFEVLKEEEKKPIELPEEKEPVKEEPIKNKDEETPSQELPPTLIYTAPKSKYYKIFLRENAKLYLKE